MENFQGMLLPQKDVHEVQLFVDFNNFFKIKHNFINNQN
jgi:hypothetical protein